MRRPAVLGAVALAALIAWPGAGGAASVQEHVSIAFASYAPGRSDVLVGDTVNWSNESTRAHTVTTVGPGFDSGTLAAHARFTHAFRAAGDYPYVCEFHPDMTGSVSVHRLLISAPTSVLAATPIPITGRSVLVPGTPVTIEADSGAGYHAVASTTIGADQSFHATVGASTTASYRARAGTETAPAVTVAVAARLRVLAHTRTTRTSSVVSVSTNPSRPHGVVVLQLHLRERFGWWPVARRRLDGRSRTRFTLHRHGRVRARVVLTLGDGVTRVATSGVVHVGLGSAPH